VVSDLSGPARLNWRLRAAFGVNARADILVALAMMAEHAMTIADLARATRFTKRNVAVAVSAMALAGVVEADRRGNEDRVRLAEGLPLRPWLAVPSRAAIDWTARLTVALRLLRAADATAGASLAVRAVELRAAIVELLGHLSEARLPRPDLTVTGSDAAGTFEAWISQLAALFRDPSE
jgi:hypothetical protein